jgi:hypothetical protein
VLQANYRPVFCTKVAMLGIGIALGPFFEPSGECPFPSASSVSTASPGELRAELIGDRLPLRYGIQCKEPKISSALSETSTRPSDQMLGLSPFRVISTNCRFLRVLVTLWKVSIFRLSSCA